MLNDSRVGHDREGAKRFKAPQRNVLVLYADRLLPSPSILAVPLTVRRPAKKKTRQSTTDAILNLELVAYGINAVNATLNLCDLLSGVLCPLPQYDFVGSATIPLPKSVTDSIDIPGIGFLIPDLEATAFGRSPLQHRPSVQIKCHSSLFLVVQFDCFASETIPRPRVCGSTSRTARRSGGHRSAGRSAASRSGPSSSRSSSSSSARSCSLPQRPPSRRSRTVHSLPPCGHRSRGARSASSS